MIFYYRFLFNPTQLQPHFNKKQILRKILSYEVTSSTDFVLNILNSWKCKYICQFYWLCYTCDITVFFLDSCLVLLVWWPSFHPFYCRLNDSMFRFLYVLLTLLRICFGRLPYEVSCSSFSTALDCWDGSSTRGWSLGIFYWHISLHQRDGQQYEWSILFCSRYVPGSKYKKIMHVRELMKV